MKTKYEKRRILRLPATEQPSKQHMRDGREKFFLLLRLAHIRTATELLRTRLLHYAVTPINTPN